MQVTNVIASATEGHAAEEASKGLFDALGINVTLLIEQSIAFLILVFVLGKWVYPVLIKAIESRRETIEAGLQEAKESQAAAEEAQSQVADLLAQARKDADDILARTHQEASSMIGDAEDKAKQRAEQIVTDARAQLDADVRKARAALKAETLQLVVAATEKVMGEKLDTTKDANLIKNAIEGKA